MKPLIIDMNLSPAWVPFLEAHGYVAHHWASLGSPAASDAEIMGQARLTNSVVLTHDLDFGTLLAQTQASGPSVIQIRTSSPLPAVAGPALLSALQQCAPELAAGALLVVDPSKHRIRLPPLTLPS